MVYTTCHKLPDTEKFGMISQLQRAVVSIPSNIAEGSSRTSDKEIVRYLEIALGSAFEVETQLLLIGDIYKIDVSELIVKLTSEQKMINAYRSKILSNINKRY